jgi:antitoxin CptB
MDDTDRLKRLKFRAWRRGFREADLILGPFVDTHGPSLTPTELSDLEVLLDQPDQDLYAWIIGREPTPPAFATQVMARIREFRFVARAARDDLGA